MDSPHKPRICISVCESTIAALEGALTAAAAQGDLIEVRLDCLDSLQLKTGRNAIQELLKQLNCESIVTFRPAEQGGRRALDLAARSKFWASPNHPSSNSWHDIELDLAEALNSSPSFRLDWRRIICSHHDFVRMPADLSDIYRRLAATPAAVLKIGVQADDALECLPLFQLLERARQDGREMIALAMGTAGLATRILGPSRGSFLTYAALDHESATAPGQISARELRQVYRLANIDQQTAIFGLLGQPVSHSFSPYMHNAAFAAAGTNAVYIPFEVNNVDAFLKRMVHPRTRELVWNLHGLSVTAPHKFAVMDRLDWIEPRALAIGAVNTIVVRDDALLGYNTDAAGFIKPLEAMCGDLRRARCAVIGAGGSACAALFSLKSAG
ncbi:MAG TPA: type I 3-dehydroquinate dehydratase, partial [Pyrinomonadaceae bacterium]